MEELEKKKETFRCFVYNEDVELIDGVCQEDCSIEECNLNRDVQPEKKPEPDKKPAKDEHR